MAKKIDFDLDDPLGDLLSDNSNDSFYKDDNYKSLDVPKPPKDYGLENKKMNLFGLEKEPTPNKELEPKRIGQSDDNWLGLVDSKSSHTTPKFEIKTNLSNSIYTNEVTNVKETRPLKGSFPDSLNFLDDLGLSDEGDNKSLKQGTNKPSILDDLLNKASAPKNKRPETPKKAPVIKETLTAGGYSPSVSSVPPNKGNAYKPSSASSFKVDVDKSVPMGKVLNKMDSSKDLMKAPKNESVPVSSKRQRSNADWLGIFPDEEEDTLEGLKTKDSQEIKEDKDWLKNSNKINAIDNGDISHKLTEKSDANTKNGGEIDNMINKVSVENYTHNAGLSDVRGSIINPLLIGSSNNVDIAQENTALCMQHQESQLMIALQLKAQEERLAAINERHNESRKVHQDVMSAHRHQLQQMLRGQAQQRDQLQGAILQHQQRINNHIKSLLTPSSLSNKNESLDYFGRENKELQNENNETKNVTQDLKIGQLTEKVQLEQLIANLTENHNKEMDIMENSYRRQIRLVDESLLQVEERLKVENDKLIHYYVQRIERLEDENLNVFRTASDKMKNIFDRQNIEKEIMEKKHFKDIEILQEQHHLVINNIRGTIATEHAIIKDTTDYSQKLSAVLNDMERNNNICADFSEKYEIRYNKDLMERERNLKIKEDQIIYMLDSLEKQRKSFEQESQDIKVSLQTLEASLKQQANLLDEERNTLKQKHTLIEREREAFQKECDIVKNVLEKDKETSKLSMKNLEERYSQMEESFSENMRRLNEEKLDISKDKKIVQDLKIQSQDLKSTLDMEVDELKEKKHKLLLEEKRLQYEETKLITRSQELEVLTRSALAKQVNAERKISEANYAQQRYVERLRRLQEHAITLNAREQEIARDKVSLSRERLMLHNEQKESDKLQCGLCKTSSLPTSLKYNNYKTDKMDAPNNQSQMNYNFLETTVTRDRLMENQYGNINNQIFEFNSTIDKNIILQNGLFPTLTDDNNYCDNFNTPQKYSLPTLNGDLDKIYPEKLESIHLNNEYYDDCKTIQPSFQEIIDPKLFLIKYDVKKRLDEN